MVGTGGIVDQVYKVRAVAVQWLSVLLMGWIKFAYLLRSIGITGFSITFSVRRNRSLEIEPAPVPPCCRQVPPAWTCVDTLGHGWTRAQTRRGQGCGCLRICVSDRCARWTRAWHPHPHGGIRAPATTIIDLTNFCHFFNRFRQDDLEGAYFSP